MADLADVLDFLEATARAAVYPNGTDQPSVSGKLVYVGQGWPMAGDVDAAVKAGSTIVSIYAVPGTSSDPGQVFDWLPGTIANAAPPMTGALAGNTLTLTDPVVGDNIAVTVNYTNTYAYTAVAGDLSQGVAAALLALIHVDFPNATRADSTITVPGIFSLSFQIGGTGTIGQFLFRQRMQFLVVVWAPTPADRSAVAAPIDIALKQNITALAPDGSQLMIVHQGTRLTDKSENEGEYRRDLIFFVTWDTIDAYPGTEIITVSPSVQLQPSS